MRPPDRPADESRRLEALRRYNLLDTSPEQGFDDLAALARHICDMPISLISLVDERRQWFKSKTGFSFSETPRDVSFCGHAITEPDLLVVPDAARDERFQDNPLVTGDPHIRFYAGAPLMTPDGHALGTLCVIDTVPRHLTPSQLEALRMLSRQVMAQLELRRRPSELEAGDARPRGIAEELVYVTDVTARTTAEEAQRVSEARYRTLFEYAPDGIVIADRDSHYVDANPSACRMLGYARDELVRLHASDIVAPAELEHIGSALQEVNAGANHQREWRFRRKDGSVFAADVLATQMPDGSLLGMIRDVTERNQAIEAVRTAEERMRFALESAGVGIWDMQYATGTLTWSAILEGLFGLRPGTFEGTFEAFLRCVHPDDHESLLRTLEEGRRSGEDFTTLYRALWPDGTVRWLSGAGRIHLGDHGEPARGIGICEDVTERRTLEEQFHQSQKMEAIGRLAGGVAHDFNNLLTVILGYCDLLMDDRDPNDPATAGIGEIREAASRAAALTRQLLAFSRKEIIEPTLLDLNDIVAGMRVMIGRLIGEDIRVLLGPDTDPVFVRADRGQVEQVVLNLAVNARDAMTKGGTLKIETTRVELDTHHARSHPGSRPGWYGVLIVTDTGTGMTPEVKARLFEPFFTTKGPGRGTGLGLATVHGIATRSGGSVTASSEPGQGASFTVYFPLADAGGPVHAPPPAVPRRVATETVLVVEDADGLRELARRLLLRHGYAVLAAANAGEALRLFEENPSIDVLLTDVVMPGASGPELTRELLMRRPALKVIYMSGYTEDAIVHHGVLNPGIAFLHKPFTSDTLGRKVREVLDG